MTLYNFTNNETLKNAAWQKALIVVTHDPNDARKDRFGNWIVWNDYGKKTQFGWEIDHVTPVSWGGLDSHSNVAATHWQANRQKSNNFAG